MVWWNKKNNQNLTGLLKETDLSLLKDQQVSTLSGGEKQRLSLTRALVSNPEILFLDEATSSLDPRSVSIIESLLKEKKIKNVDLILELSFKEREPWDSIIEDSLIESVQYWRKFI